MYLTSSGRDFLPLVSWDQAVTPVYIVLTVAYLIQGKEEECMIHIRANHSSFKKRMFLHPTLSDDGYHLFRPLAECTLCF